MPAWIIQMMAFTQIRAIWTPGITLQEHLKETMAPFWIQIFFSELSSFTMPLKQAVETGFWNGSCSSFHPILIFRPLCHQKSWITKIATLLWWMSPFVFCQFYLALLKQTVKGTTNIPCIFTLLWTIYVRGKWFEIKQLHGWNSDINIILVWWNSSFMVFH